jgi:hypothetical protein
MVVLLLLLLILLLFIVVDNGEEMVRSARGEMNIFSVQVFSYINFV